MTYTEPILGTSYPAFTNPDGATLVSWERCAETRAEAYAHAARWDEQLSELGLDCHLINVCYHRHGAVGGAPLWAVSVTLRVEDYVRGRAALGEADCGCDPDAGRTCAEHVDEEERRRRA